MTKRVAVLDVGSNSVRLMVADTENGQVRVLCRRTITTRLMEALENGAFTENGMRRTAEVMKQLRGEAEQQGAQEICAFGTSAMRDAKNSACLSQMAEMNIEVMAGDMEARLAYMGAAPQGRCGIVDIGGGSTEFIVGQNGCAEEYSSYNIGAVRLNIACGQWDETSLLAKAEELLRPAALFGEAGAQKWIGVGGTITTLAAMTRRVDKYSPGAIEGCPLTESLARFWYHRLMEMTVDQRRAIPGLSARRADIIHCGAAIFLAAMRVTRAPVLFASDHDNLEGFIRCKFAG